MKLTNTIQYAVGKTVEAYLDVYFSGRGYRIELMTQHEERVQKIGDRHFYDGDRHLKVEYKSGIQTYYTGNVFLETISVDSDGTPGWVYTSRADYIVYAALLNNLLLIFRPEDLREKIEGLKLRFKTVKTGKGQNAGYNTHGVIVPLAVAESELAYKVIRLTPQPQI